MSRPVNCPVCHKAVDEAEPADKHAHTLDRWIVEAVRLQAKVELLTEELTVALETDPQAILRLRVFRLETVAMRDRR